MGKMNKDQFAALAGAVVVQLPRGLDAEVATRWIDDPSALRGVLDRALRAGPPLPADPDAWVNELDLAKVERHVFEITIDPTQTIEQMVGAGGYNYADPNHTTALFGVCRKITGVEPVKQKVVAFRIGRNATREQAKLVRARLNLGKICIQHELALGAQHKQAQRDLNWIVNADDEVLVVDCRRVSYLNGGLPDYRRLGLHDAGREWYGRTWFLGLPSE